MRVESLPAMRRGGAPLDRPFGPLLRDAPPGTRKREQKAIRRLPGGTESERSVNGDMPVRRKCARRGLRFSPAPFRSKRLFLNVGPLG